MHGIIEELVTDCLHAIHFFPSCFFFFSPKNIYQWYRRFSGDGTNEVFLKMDCECIFFIIIVDSGLQNRLIEKEIKSFSEDM